ncbi:UDP-GlcNAc:undecaprenyl-phosphate GlcNAc-1-phosphate transferase [Candidatus Gastranaerophilus sp. (ex Termes propinquus)]|nr:UDP-GlcNAc:undecaprenyl-phosphate GlcNAc-1-phosphate transferase [Candidatus Gastranaerophilus sp. (ex Termes propinquus)]GBF23129.1 UDP-GlcNAc:undecaprenyl-phosphate GlcNAc-1-phosphate transferase [Candidatus Gastranaerophilus sp. (ex Termes propinquus)]
MIQLTQAHIIGAIIAYLLGIFTVPLVIYFSRKAGLTDKPNARKIHSEPISRLGGVAIWLCVMLTFLFLVLLSYYPKGVGLSGIVVGGSLMFLLGLVDDVLTLGAKFKLVIQVAIATMVILLGVRIDALYNPFGAEIQLGLVSSYILSLLWIVGVSNAINFIDGIDGLAGSVVAIACGAIGVISLVIIPSSPISALVAFILMGAVFAFLTFNYSPAKIFMGDSGALFAGFMLATLSISGIMKAGSALMYLPLLILIVPILDVAYSIVRRTMKGSSPFVADSEHIHHKLLHSGHSQNHTVIILATVAMLAAILAIIIAGSFSKYYMFAVVLVGILILLSVVSRLIKKNS